MDWPNEDYVRLYTRETADDLELSWEALALWRSLLIRFDRAGLIQIKNGWTSVARLVRMPIEIVQQVGPELVRDGRIRMIDGAVYAPNFLEAQTASKSDRLRQKESRERRRMSANDAAQVHDSIRDSHEPSHVVTPSHTPSQNVTLPLLCSADPLLKDSPPARDAQESLGLKTDTGTAKASQPAKPKSVANHQPAVDAFHAYYAGAHDGAEPTWDPTRIGMIVTLVRKHSTAEVVRRIGVLSASPPLFPPQPWDLATFVQHFDKCATATRAGPQRPGDQIRITRLL